MDGRYLHGPVPAESLIERRGFDPVDQLKNTAAGWTWTRARPAVLRHQGHHQKRVAEVPGDRGEEPALRPDRASSAGNGSLMRLAPVPLAFAALPGRGQEKRVKARSTHAVLDCVDACRYLGGLITGAVRGASKDSLVSGASSPPRAFGGPLRFRPPSTRSPWALSETRAAQDQGLRPCCPVP